MCKNTNIYAKNCESQHSMLATNYYNLILESCNLDHNFEKIHKDIKMSRKGRFSKLRTDGTCVDFNIASIMIGASSCD